MTLATRPRISLNRMRKVSKNCPSSVARSHRRSEKRAQAAVVEVPAFRARPFAADKTQTLTIFLS